MASEKYLGVYSYYSRPKPVETDSLSEKFTYWYPLVISALATRKRMAIMSSLAEHPEGAFFADMHQSYRRYAGLPEEYDAFEKQADHTAVTSAAYPLHNTKLLTFGPMYSHTLSDAGKKLLPTILPIAQDAYEKGLVPERRFGSIISGVDMAMHVLFTLHQGEMDHTQLSEVLMSFPVVDAGRIKRSLENLTSTYRREEEFPLIEDNGKTVKLTPEGKRVVDHFLKPIAEQVVKLLLLENT